MTLVERCKQPIILTDLRRHPLLDDMLILRRGNRLSVTPVTTNQWRYILKLTADIQIDNANWQKLLKNVICSREINFKTHANTKNALQTGKN